MHTRSNAVYTRRDVLAGGLAAASALALAGSRVGAASPDDSPYGPFKMGVQSFSLRGYQRDHKADLAKALAVTQELGLKYWESYPDHVPVSVKPRELAPYKERVASAGVKVVGYGVVRLTKDQAKNRAFFEFAKLMGISYLSADPDPACFDGVDKLIEEFDVAVGIHNHGPRHRFGKIDTIAAALKDHHVKFGCCIDTGHFLRAGEDPVRAVEVFDKRMYGVHLKDVQDTKTFTILGQGDLRTVDLLKALARLKYDDCLALEYEEHPEDPQADLRACLKATREAVGALKGAGR
jgi:inosose dehydratase